MNGSDDRAPSCVDGDAERALTLELEGVAERWLRPQIERVQQRHAPFEAKIIYDVLWGPVHLQPWEVAIFDSPLLQRLRYVRQLGVVHWVYPSASHSRLEHSLGVLNRMTCLLEGLARRAALDGSPAVGDDDAKLLRIAALVHDCGHSAMSHVSETFIAAIPGMQALRARLRVDHGARELPSPSEAIAAVLVRSPAFEALLALPELAADFDDSAEGATRRITALLLGGGATPRERALSLLLSGPFDADKLDYMPRDCLMSGLTCDAAVHRVFEAVSLAERDAPDGTRELLLTLTAPADDVLAALATTRSALYERVYFHPKVRAAETMARRALGRLGQRTASEWLELVDDDLLLDRRVPHFKALRERCLMKRVLMLPRPESGDPQSAAWHALTEALPRLEQEVQREALEIAARLGQGEAALKEEPVAVDLPPTTKVRVDLSTITVACPGPESITRERSQSERAMLQPVYVFAPEEAVIPVLLACRAVLATEFGIDIDGGAHPMARVDPSAMALAEERLLRLGHRYRSTA